MTTSAELSERVDALEKRLTEHNAALNNAIEARGIRLFAIPFGVLQMLAGVGIFWISVDASQPWMQLLGLSPAIGLLPSVLLATAVAYGVMRLLSPVVTGVAERGVREFPKLPDWQKSEAND